MPNLQNTSEGPLMGVWDRKDRFRGIKKRGAAIDYEDLGGGVRAQMMALTATRPLVVPVRSLQNNWLNYAAGTDPTAILSAVMLPGGGFQYSGVLKKTGNTYTSGETVCDPINGFEPFRSVRKVGVIVDTAGTVQRLSEYTVSGYNSATHVIAAETIGTAAFVPVVAGVDITDVSANMSGACYFRNADVSDDVAILFPKNFTGLGVKVALYCHGAGDDYLSILSSPSSATSTQRLVRNVFNALLDDGFVIVSYTGGTIGDHWGNPPSWLATKAALDLVQSLLPVDKIVLVGQSMGGTASLRALANYEGITNWFGFYPVCSIAAQVAGYSAQINTAFAASGGYAANASACDPLLLATSLFAGKRMMCVASAADTAVSKAANADALMAKVSGVAAVASVTATAGNHGDASNWTTGIATQMLAHLNS
jgi:pimeloyl-ACP methyl ester carboxylesterase